MSSAGCAGFARSVESVHVIGRRREAWGLALATLFLASAPLLAAAGNDGERLTSLARQALDNDTQLGALNLGVSVRGPVATVWGTVPSPSAGERAVLCLRRVPGVERVENQLTVESPGDSLFDFLKLPARPWSPKPIPGMRALDPAATAPQATRTSHGPVPLGPEFMPGPVPVFTPAPAAAPPMPTTAPAIVSSPAPPPSKLASRAPEAVAAAPIMPLIPLPVTRPIPVPLHDTTPVKAEPDDLERAIARLQQGNDRLRGIKTEVRGGAVYLRGNTRDWQELQAFARQIAELPGVERVVLDGVRSTPR